MSFKTEDLKLELFNIESKNQLIFLFALLEWIWRKILKP